MSWSAVPPVLPRRAALELYGEQNIPYSSESEGSQGLETGCWMQVQ